MLTDHLSDLHRHARVGKIYCTLHVWKQKVKVQESEWIADLCPGRVRCPIIYRFIIILNCIHVRYTSSRSVTARCIVRSRTILLVSHFYSLRIADRHTSIRVVSFVGPCRYLSRSLRICKPGRHCRRHCRRCRCCCCCCCCYCYLFVERGQRPASPGHRVASLMV